MAVQSICIGCIGVEEMRMIWCVEGGAANDDGGDDDDDYDDDGSYEEEDDDDDDDVEDLQKEIQDLLKDQQKSVWHTRKLGQMIKNTSSIHQTLNWAKYHVHFTLGVIVTSGLKLKASKMLHVMVCILWWKQYLQCGK